MSRDPRLDRLLDRQAIADLRYRYCHRVDDGDYDAWADLFAPEGVLDVEGRAPLSGRAAVRAFGADVLAEEYAHTAHLVCNPLLSVEDGGDRASGRWSLLLCYERRDGTAGWRQGRYEETYVTIDGAWRFEAVRATFGVEDAFRSGN